MSLFRRELPVFIALMLCCASTAPAIESDPDETARFDTFTVYWENDIFTGTDRDYTNGLKLTWSTPFLKDRNNSKLPEWSYSFIEMIPFAYHANGDQALSLSVGQNIYTPEDTSRTDLIIDDRPYAGHMYLGIGIQNRYRQHIHSWELNLGVVGPHSYADDLQMWLHENTGSDPANGWGNQLDDEPTLDIIFETKWRLFRKQLTPATSFDAITHLGGRLGNVAIYMNTGTEIRYGYRLPNDFGICTIRGGCELNSSVNNGLGSGGKSFYFFTAVDGRAIARNIFLDGNTFEESHSVDKRNLVGDVIVGFAFKYSRLTSTYAYVFRSQQYEQQDHGQEFGSISFSISF